MVLRYIIIGTGPAAISAAEVIRDQCPSDHLLLIGEEPYGFYSRPGLAYYLTGEVTERQLFLRQGKPFQRVTAKAVKIDPKSQRVVTDDGTSRTYDSLLIATGSAAIRLTVPGADLKGVLKLDNMHDARMMRELARRGKTAVVIGGGITALEIVEAFVSRGVKTHYFLRGDRYWRDVLDQAESRIVEQRLKDEGVHLHYHTSLSQIIGRGGRAAGVQTEDGRQIQADIVAVAVGVRPRLDLAQASGLETDRGILTDEHMETSASNVFAAGDVAQVFDPIVGKTVLNSLWGMAVIQGHVAGLNMAGIKTVYHQGVPFNVTCLAGLITTIIGSVGRGTGGDLLSIARGDSETWRQWRDGFGVRADSDARRLRVIIGEENILGALVMGDQTLSRILCHLIANRVNITTIRDLLLDDDTDLVRVIDEFWRNGSRQHEPSWS